MEIPSAGDQSIPANKAQEEQRLTPGSAVVVSGDGFLVIKERLWCRAYIEREDVQGRKHWSYAMGWKEDEPFGEFMVLLLKGRA